MKVATLQSQEIVSRRDLSAAYRYLSITPVESKTLSDVLVIERYQARLPDQSAASQQEAREHLYKIGIARDSALLLNASRQSVDTYEDALNWLGNGVNKDTPDEGILAVLSIKVLRSCLAAPLADRQPKLIFVHRLRKAKPTKKSDKRQLLPSLKNAKVTISTTSSLPVDRTDTR